MQGGEADPETSADAVHDSGAVSPSPADPAEHPGASHQPPQPRSGLPSAAVLGTEHGPPHPAPRAEHGRAHPERRGSQCNQAEQSGDVPEPSDTGDASRDSTDQSLSEPLGVTSATLPPGATAPAHSARPRSQAAGTHGRHDVAAAVYPSGAAGPATSLQRRRGLSVAAAPDATARCDHRRQEECDAARVHASPRRGDVHASDECQQQHGISQDAPPARR